jgi:hypothetical protein
MVLQAGCVTHETPTIAAAEIGARVAVDGWEIADSFDEVSFADYQSGDVVIVPIKAVRNGQGFNTRRAAYTYELDLPDPNAPIRARYQWGSAPIDNGHGTYHYLHERLAFDLRARRVFVLPRGGAANVERSDSTVTKFWCGRDALGHTTAAIVGYGKVCPTAFLRTTERTKGPPLLVGLQQEEYVVDTRFIASLIGELQLEQAVASLQASEAMSRQLAEVEAAAAQAQLAQAAELARTAHERGQKMIDDAALGSLLCADIRVGAQPAVVSAFLEGKHDAMVQLRVNTVNSPDGRTRIELKVPIDGVLYAQGGIVWVAREHWRACE